MREGHNWMCWDLRYHKVGSPFIPYAAPRRFSWGPYYVSDMTLSQTSLPVAAQTSIENFVAIDESDSTDVA